MDETSLHLASYMDVCHELNVDYKDLNKKFHYFYDKSDSNIFASHIIMEPIEQTTTNKSTSSKHPNDETDLPGPSGKRHCN